MNGAMEVLAGNAAPIAIATGSTGGQSLLGVVLFVLCAIGFVVSVGIYIARHRG